MCKHIFPHAPYSLTHLYAFLFHHTYTHLVKLSQTHTYTNGRVIKNEAIGFLKTPRTKGKVSGTAVKRVPLETMRRMIICCS